MLDQECEWFRSEPLSVDVVKRLTTHTLQIGDRERWLEARVLDCRNVPTVSEPVHCEHARSRSLHKHMFENLHVGYTIGRARLLPPIAKIMITSFDRERKKSRISLQHFFLLQGWM